jgi:hypothetical protein
VNLIFAGTTLAEVASGSSSESPIIYVKEDNSHNGDLMLFVTSEGQLIQSRKRKWDGDASSVFVTYENYYVDIDNNDVNVKRKKSDMYRVMI